MNQPEDRNEIRSVDAGAVAEILAEEGLEHRLEERSVRTGFVNAAIVLAVDDDSLAFEALWRGEFPRDLAPQVVYACNEHNQSAFAPTLRYFEGDGGTLSVNASRTLDIGHGASFNQLGAFVVSSIDATLRAFDFLAATFPTLVTWEDPHNEH